MYSHLVLGEFGYIKNLNGLLCHNAKLPPDTLGYNTIKSAKEHRPTNPDLIIVAAKNGHITHAYFTKLQMKRGFYQRLNIFQGCYGSIKVRELP